MVQQFNFSSTPSTDSTIKVIPLLIVFFISINGIVALPTAPTFTDNSITSLVTGSNGYVGKAVVHELLRRSNEQDIVCLVRASKVNKEQAYWNNVLKDIKEENKIIRVMPYDMLDGGSSLKIALETTKDSHQRRVFHVASVFGPTTDHQETALDNVRGTEDLVRTIANVGNCKLILTSSMAAVRGTGQSPMNGMYYTHDDWNTKSVLGANWGESYQWSKAESERKAWELTKKLDVPMVSLCPSFVFGPPYGDSDSYSLQLVEQWLTGRSPVQSRLFVDIRDCAIAHVNAAIKDDVNGRRYIVSTDSRISSQIVATWLQDACRQTKKGDWSLIRYDTNFVGGAIAIGDKEVEATIRLRNDLGLELQSVEHTIIDMAEKLLKYIAT